MRRHILGTGLILGLAVTVFVGPVAWADNAESTPNPGNNAVTPFLRAPDKPLAPGQEIRIQGYRADPQAGPRTSEAVTGIEVLDDPGTASTVLDTPVVGTAQAAVGQSVPVPVPGDGDGQMTRPRGVPETGDETERTGSGPQMSLSTLVVGLALGAAAGAGAIAWREVRR